VLAILGLAVRFTSTFAFQVGLIGHLLRQFSATILVALLCLVLSILLHFFSLRDRWSSQEEEETVAAHRSYQSWQTGVTILFVLQRTGECCRMRRFMRAFIPLVSALHYFLYKRTIMTLTDPKYHRESEWLLQKIGKRMGKQAAD
jgi:hypothetical protein